MKKQYIVCNVDGSTHQKRFKIRKNFPDAVQEANRLASENPGKHFMVMETVGGFVQEEGKVKPVEVEE